MKLWASLRDHPKWVPLSLEERGAWATLALIACAAQPVRGEIASRAHATALLSRDAPDSDAEALVDRLLDADLLDKLPGGRIGLHDFEAWQVPPSHTREGERDRKRRARAQRQQRPNGSVGTDAEVSQGKIERPSEERALYRESAPLEARAGASRLRAARASRVHRRGPPADPGRHLRAGP